MLQTLKQFWRDTKRGMSNTVDLVFFLIIIGFAVADFFVKVPLTGFIALSAVYVFSLIVRVGNLQNRE